MSTPATTQQLCSAIVDMDRTAQGAFSQIGTMAQLALVSLETPEAYANLESMATVLKAICARAEDTENSINAMAEEVGCNYKDPAECRRFDARRRASKPLTIEGAL